MSGLVIVGGGAAGLATARAYRDASGDGRVTMLTAEPDAPYVRPLLSKGLLRGETDEAALEEDAWYVNHDVDLRREAEVEAIDPERRRLRLAGGEELAFDSCVLATGSEPVRPPFPGADDPDVLTLRSLHDAWVLRSRAEEAHSAIVIGSGFIGCEAAASLSMRGLRVTLVSDEHAVHAARLGAEAGRRITDWLVELGVSLRLGAPVESAGPNVVRTPGAPANEADLVLLAVGVRPRVQLAEAAGLATEGGRVVTDEHMRTSAPGVYAVGDIAFASNVAAGRRLRVEHWGEATNHGKAAGTHAAGGEAPWSTAPGFLSTIGTRTLKQVAWGDGYDEARMVVHPGGAFTVWYGADGTTVGVLTHESDDDYERGRELIEQGRPLP
jgi:3-phenylpropionate/trans-cinnamate dioxygenase ferredoxin reductase component